MRNNRIGCWGAGGGGMKIFRARIFSFMSPMSAGFFSLGLSLHEFFFSNMSSFVTHRKINVTF